MFNTTNEISEVYVIFKDTDCIHIEVICANREALQKYMEEQRLQLEEELKKNCPTPEITRVKTFYDEEYEITAQVPTNNFEIMYSELEGSSAKQAEVWAANCISPFRKVKVFTSEHAAKEWISNIDDPEELNFIEKHELQF